MYFTTILVAVLLAPSVLSGRDAARSVSGSGPARAAPVPGDSQQPAVDPVKASGDAKPSEARTEEGTPPDKNSAESSSQKAPSSQSTGARKRRPRKMKTAAPTAEGEPRKIVIHQGGASEPTAQILPGVTQEEANRQRESAKDLLAACESALKVLAVRALNPTQQEMVVQIRQYADGARSALKESDTQRAHTLALKAYLLSDDLVKH